jgi:probable addiction module antidote protein
MPIETLAWEPYRYLTSTSGQDEYLRAALEDAQADGSPGLIAAALGDIAKARGMSEIAVSAGVTREALYKSLSDNGDPRLSTMLGVVKALGYRLEIEPLVSERGKIVGPRQKVVKKATPVRAKSKTGTTRRAKRQISA